MNTNQWTRGLITAGVISLGAVAQAEETAISGYVSTTATWAPNVMTPANASFMPTADGFDLDNVDITIAKALDEGEWASGYAVELWAGPQAANLGNNIGGAGGNGNDLAIKQANVQLNAPVGNGLVLTMGVFDAIIGYESANIGENPNVTRSYGFTMEPFQHLGLLASYQISEAASLSVGVADANNTILNPGNRGLNNSAKTYMAAVSLTAPESLGPLGGTSITAGVVDGRAGGAGGPDTTQIYLGGDIPTPIENLSLGLAWDHINVGGASDSDSIAAYIGYKATEKLGINTRIDYLDQGNANGGGAGVNGGEFLGTTVTADYALWENVVTRAEWRWDKDLDSDGFGRAANARNNNHLFLLNAIYNF